MNYFLLLVGSPLGTALWSSDKMQETDTYHNTYFDGHSKHSTDLAIMKQTNVQVTNYLH